MQSPQQHMAQNLQHMVQIPQQIGADGGLRATVGRDTGAIPRPNNLFYFPRTNYQDRIVSSTPPTHAQSIRRSPNLSPINSRAPPGFAYPQHEQGPNQAQNTRLNSSGNVSAPVSQTLETQTGRLAPPRNPQVNTSGQFKPIKGTKYLPTSAPGCILNTKKDQEISSDMWLKASLDLAWEASGHIPPSVLITHLENFNFHSQAITPFILDRLNTNVLLWPSEI